MKKLIFPVLAIMFALNASANVTEEIGPKPKAVAIPAIHPAKKSSGSKAGIGITKPRYNAHRKPATQKGKPFGSKKYNRKLVTPGTTRG